MRNSLPCLTVVLGLCWTSATLAEDTLFSQVPIDSVFTPQGAQANTGPRFPFPPQQNPPPENTEKVRLIDLVWGAGFQPTQLSESVITTKVQLERWEFPVLVSEDKDAKQVHLVLLLGVVKDESQVSPAKLLQLLEASREHAPAYFAYSAKRKRTELHRVLEEEAPKAELIRDTINQMAEIAKETEALWTIEETSAKETAPKQVASTTPPPAAPQPVTTAPQPKPGTPAPTAPTATSTSLIGKWSASRSKTEAFAIQLNADGTFRLVHVKNGKQTRSQGRFTFQKQTLTLTGDDGANLAGGVVMPTEKEFRFQPQSAGKTSASLTFRRAS